MIKITKRTELKEWTEYRNTPGVDYQAIPELVDALLQEQGYLCAYCMRRIPCRDNASSENHRIEHVLSRENHPDKRLSYNNMVICCPGHIGGDEHCDRKKGCRDVTFDLTDAHFIATISYKFDGEIVSSNPQFNSEINEILNLNTPLLKANRKATWEGVTKQLCAARGSKAWNKAMLAKELQKYSAMHNREGKLKYIAYCGVVVYHLQKKLKQLHG